VDVFWTGFIGVIVGGLVSLGTLVLTNHHQNTILDREVSERTNARRRDAVADLLGGVSNDIARFRGEVSPVQKDGSNMELAEFLDGMSTRIGTAADLARAVAASVPDAAVREAAQQCYDAWYAFATGQINAIVNETKESTSDLSEMASTKAPEEFYTAVQEYLAKLDATP
jgi:hypothetical protein